jgi:hypothetical protein
MTTPTPFRDFKQRLGRFAAGQHGIRNPFVIVPVRPRLEDTVATKLESWAEHPQRTADFPNDATVQSIHLGEIFASTRVFQLLLDLEDRPSPADVEGTMQDQLAEEMVGIMLEEITQTDQQRHVVLLLHLGSLYPFTRASELLDELDRRNVQSTVGIPFPGDIIGGRLSFFGEESRAYYPAHRIDGQIEGVHLQ